MSFGTTTLNPGTGGDRVLYDLLTALNGGTPPSQAVVQVIKLAFGAPDAATLVDPSNGLPVQPATGAAFLGRVLSPTDTFTRPANTTAYASGQLVANSTTAASVAPMTLTVAAAAGGSFMLRRAKLAKSGTSVTNASFRVHFYSAAPSTIANGDGAAWSSNGVESYLGAMDVTMDRVFTNGACGFGVPMVGSDITVKLASGTTIRALIEARGAYTPASGETFTLTLDDIVAV